MATIESITKQKFSGSDHSTIWAVGDNCDSIEMHVAATARQVYYTVVADGIVREMCSADKIEEIHYIDGTSESFARQAG